MADILLSKLFFAAFMMFVKKITHENKVYWVGVLISIATVAAFPFQGGRWAGIGRGSTFIY